MRSSPQSRWGVSAGAQIPRSGNHQGSLWKPFTTWSYFHKSEVSECALMVPLCPATCLYLVLLEIDLAWIALYFMCHLPLTHTGLIPKVKEPTEILFYFTRKFSTKLNQGSCMFGVQNGIVEGGWKRNGGISKQRNSWVRHRSSWEEERWCPNQWQW